MSTRLILMLLATTLLVGHEARGQRVRFPPAGGRLQAAPVDAESHARLEKAVFGLG